MDKVKYVILDVGLAYKQEEFKDLFSVSKYKLLYIGERCHVDWMKKEVQSDNVEYYPYENLYRYNIKNFEQKCKHDLNEVINYIVNDKLTTHLYDRTMSTYLFNYAMHAEVKLIEMTIAAYKFILDKQPEFMLLYECSHNVRSWVIGRVCEFCGIPVRYCRNHIFMWRNVLLEGMNKYAKLLGDETINSHYTDWEWNMFQEIMKRYDNGTEAIKPEYIEVMKEKKMKKLYSLKKDIMVNWKRPIHVWYKNKVYRSYEKLCTTNIPEKYIVFYLHLQPERTTLPEGYGFTQQYKAILLLNEIIPENWHVVVKEHPATFYRYCTPFGRWCGFYQALAALQKVVLVPLETDTYQLMTNSRSVVTITGTVTREALMMGKPSITFGIDPYFGEFPYGVYNYKDYDSLKAFVDGLERMDSARIKKEFADYIKKTMLKTGTLGISEGEEWINKESTVMNCNRVSRLKLHKYILSK